MRIGFYTVLVCSSIALSLGNVDGTRSLQETKTVKVTNFTRTAKHSAETPVAETAGMTYASDNQETKTVQSTDFMRTAKHSAETTMVGTAGVTFASDNQETKAVQSTDFEHIAEHSAESTVVEMAGLTFVSDEAIVKNDEKEKSDTRNSLINIKDNIYTDLMKAVSKKNRTDSSRPKFLINHNTLEKNKKVIFEYSKTVVPILHSTVKAKTMDDEKVIFPKGRDILQNGLEKNAIKETLLNGKSTMQEPGRNLQVNKPPSTKPSAKPSAKPSSKPSAKPSSKPSAMPSAKPDRKSGG
jgi:hypothetical protein